MLEMRRDNRNHRIMSGEHIMSNNIFLESAYVPAPWYTKILLCLIRRRYSIDVYDGGYTVVIYKMLFDVIYIMDVRHYSTGYVEKGAHIKLRIK